MNPPRAFSAESYALFCDEYELTMAQSFWLHRENERACFEMSVRHLPPQRGYLVCAGLEQVLAFLATLHFSDDDLAYLRGSGAYRDGFLDFLARVRFSGDVDAIAEGTVVGADTPLLRVTAPRIAATLVESALLSIVNHQTSIASKAARVVDAARGRDVWDFSLRRVHGPDAALGVARAAYLAGAAGTATVVAGQRLGIPTTGTMAHHYVLAFGPDHEQDAYEQFLRDYPGRGLLLIDTYDTVRGAELAIAACRATGIPLAGVRLDSGDIATLSREVRRRFDAAGLQSARIVASGDLDEKRIDAILQQSAAVDSFGVGTMLGTSYDAPALGGVYKLVAQQRGDVMEPVMKRSAGKVTDPGVHQVFRHGGWDTVSLQDEALPGRALMRCVMREGVAGELPSLEEARRYCAAERAAVPGPQRRIVEPEPWPVRRSERLESLRAELEA